jgi:hypothetical protein
MIIFTMTLLRWHPSGCASCPDHLLRSEIAHRAVLTSMFQIWLQHVQPGEICYQQRRMRPYISVAHPFAAVGRAVQPEMSVVTARL